MSRKILCTGLIPALIFACGGCSSNNEKSKSTDNKPTVTTKDGLPVWETKQDQVRYLTVKDKIGDYNISFYEDFELVNTPKAKVEVKTWKTKIPNAGPLVGPLVFSVAVITDAKMAGETIQNPRQSLVDYTGGMANSAKLNGVQRGDLEQGHIHGLTFSRIE